MTGADKRMCVSASLAVGLALACGVERAQLSMSAGLVSDYRLRGISLSGEKWAPQFNLTYDSASGWYAGAFVSRALLYHTDINAQMVTYGGYARRFGDGLSWEVGATEALFNRGCKYNYGELLAGLSGDRIGARLYYSPDYLGMGVRTGYAELNANYPLAEKVDLTAHLGYFRPLSEDEDGPHYAHYPPMPRKDGKFGVSVALDAWTVQLAWVATEHDATLTRRYRNTRASTLVLSTARAF